MIIQDFSLEAGKYGLQKAEKICVLPLCQTKKERQFVIQRVQNHFIIGNCEKRKSLYWLCKCKYANAGRLHNHYEKFVVSQLPVILLIKRGVNENEENYFGVIISICNGKYAGM